MTVITSPLFLPSSFSDPGLGPEEEPNNSSNRSNFGDANALPPRYSFLTNVLPPNTSLAVVSTIIDSMELTLDGTTPSLRPPRYSSVFQSRSRNRDERLRQRRGRLNSTYEGDRTTTSGSSSLRLHEFHIKGGTKHLPWAILKIYSLSSAHSPSESQDLKVPRFTGNELVQGAFDLNLDSPQTINSINLTFRGRILTSSYEGGSYTFLEHQVVSWNRSRGDPRSNDARPSSNSSKKFEGKLSGNYSWPFSFPFPTSVVIPGNGENASNTPQTFFERGIQGNVCYEFILRMTHGLLRSDSRLNTDVIYVPEITPSPSSILRQLSHGESFSVPGPEQDPVGWFTLPPSTMRGRFLGDRHVKLQCTLSLANPKSYTRGAFIPCHLSIYTSDSEALEALATPKSICVRLVRRVQYYQDAGNSVISHQARSNASSSVSGSSSSLGNMVEHRTEVERAVWWVSQNVTGTIFASESTLRQFSGEIHLDKQLQPSCDFPLFKVSYFVEFYSLKNTNFEPRAPGGSRANTSLNDIRSDTTSLQALVSHPVTIATIHGEGPIPVSFTKPKPRKERRHRRPHSGRDFTANGSWPTMVL